MDQPIWRLVGAKLTENITRSPTRVRKSAFVCRHPPAIPLLDYLVRLYNHCFCADETFVIMLVLLTRWRDKTGDVFHSKNIHCLCLASLVTAIKIHEDVYYANSYYAPVGGLDMSALHICELAFMTDLGWTLWVSPEVFWETRRDLQPLPLYVVAKKIAMEVVVVEEPQKDDEGVF